MHELDLIQKLEPTFIKAGELAVSLRSEAKSYSKFKSGIEDIDIVTSSDLTVQEFILQALAETELKNCEIVAEEDTPSKDLFAKESKYVITIDPIDGTKLYATGKNNYTGIVTLHNKVRPLYTFDYYPELKWGIKIVNDEYEFMGSAPKIDVAKQPKTITYSAYGATDPKVKIPELHKELTARGYEFKSKKDVWTGLGATGQLLLGIVGGLYVEDGSAVDCLAGLHFAMANKFKIYNQLDTTKPYPSDKTGGGDEYKGWYLVINERAA